MVINPKGARTYWSTHIWKGDSNDQELVKLYDLFQNVCTTFRVRYPTILDLCCGTGDFTIYLLSKLGLDSIERTYCLDVNPDVLENLRKRVETTYGEKAKDKITAVCEYFGNPIGNDPSTPVDIVVCARSLLHFPRLDLAFQGIRSRLKENGIFIADIVPESSREKSLRERYGLLTTEGIQTLYHFAESLALHGIGSEFFSRVGILRSQFPEISEVNTLLTQSGFEILQSEIDNSTNYYRFAARPIRINLS